MEDSKKSSLTDLFTSCETPYYGWTDNYETALSIIKLYEVDTESSFIIATAAHGNFGRADGESLNKHHIRFDLKLEESESLNFNGVPFIIANNQKLTCYRGPKRNAKKNLNLVQDHDYGVKLQKTVQPSKKLNCPASITLREIILFPDFGIANLTEWRKKQVSKKLRMQLAEASDSVKQERRIYVTFPKPDEHKGHNFKVIEDCLQRLDARMIKKIKNLVRSGINKTTDVIYFLNEYLKDNANSWFKDGKLPSYTNRQFFPSPDIVRSHINKVLNKLKFSFNDQENLEILIEQWSALDPNDQYFLRQHKIINSENDNHGEHSQPFLFVCQTKEQKYILNRYGNDFCLLDATYKTMKYALPCFLLCVKTNVNYYPVSLFICMSETSDAIAEALQIIKDWNPQFQPKYFMTDFCEAEINAINKIFPTAFTFICDFHREQAWLRWTSLKANGVSDSQTDILKLLRQVADANTSSDFDDKVKELQCSAVFQRSQLNHYFFKVWYPHYKRWASAFRPTDVVINVNTTNGVERLNRTLKRTYLDRYKDKSISSIITIIREKFLPDLYRKYVRLNAESSTLYKQYLGNICPPYLQNKPKPFVRHCISRLENSNYAQDGTVKKISDFEFMVKSEENSYFTHTVFLGTELQLPHCSCKDWKKFKYPCKHFFVVFKFIKGGWVNLHTTYRESVFHTLDSSVTDTQSSIEQYKASSSTSVANQLSEIYEENSPLKLDSSVTGISSSIEHHEASSSISADNQQIEIPVKSSPLQLQHSARECRELLREITSSTYNLDETVIDGLYPKLLDLKSWIGSCSNQDGLQTFLEHPRTTQKKRNRDISQLRPLPMKKRKKK